MCGKDLAPTACSPAHREVAVKWARRVRQISSSVKEIQEAVDQAAKRAEMIGELREAFSNPYVAAGRDWSIRLSNPPRRGATWLRS